MVGLFAGLYRARIALPTGTDAGKITILGYYINSVHSMALGGSEKPSGG